MDWPDPESAETDDPAAMFPGNVAIRPRQAVVEEALDERPSIGYISELRVEAGRRARQLLRELNYRGIGRVIVGRDETFFHGLPVLLVIEPVSMTILLAEVCADRSTELTPKPSGRYVGRSLADRPGTRGKHPGPD